MSLTNQPKIRKTAAASTAPGGSLQTARRIIRKTQKIGTISCGAWRQGMRRQAVSGKIQKREYNERKQVPQSQYGSDHTFISLRNKTSNTNSPNLNALLNLTSSLFPP